MTHRPNSETPAKSSVWVSRRWGSWLVRAIVIGGPLAASVAVAWALSRWLLSPATPFSALVRWLAIAGVSTVVLLASNRVFRRLLPLAALLKLTLSFPDTTPSRFRIALRSGSTRLLRQRIEDAADGQLSDTPAEAAVTVLELVAALSVHDRLTRGHSERVRAYTQLIGEQMGLTGVELDRLRWAGLLHDIGKLRVPTEILNKPGRLTAAEFEMIKSHPEQGRQIIRPLIPWLGDAARAVSEHHERWDGGGYPRGLAGGDIARSARIVSVADSFDVMTSVRSYKKPMPAREARAELARCAGTQFDPVTVRAFLAVSLWPVARVTGPMSWLAQASFFPTGVFTAGGAPGLAATAVVGAAAATLGTIPFETATPARAGEIEVRDDADLGDESGDDTLNEVRGRTPAGSATTTTAATAPTPDTSPNVTTNGTTPATITATTTATISTDTPPPPSPGSTTQTTVTQPTVTQPTVTQPTVPDDTTIVSPSIPTIPTIPTTTGAPVTTPVITIPVTIPGLTIPGVTLPLASTPEVTTPPVSIPPITIPSVTLPTVPPIGGPGGLLGG